MKKILCLFILLAFAANYTIAQKNKPKREQLPLVLASNKIRPQISYSWEDIKYIDMERLSNRKLLVVIAEPDKDVIEKLKANQALIRSYTSGIARLNKNMKDVFTKFWNTGNGIEFKTADEISQITNKSDYVVAYCYSATYPFPDDSDFNLPIYKSNIHYTDKVLMQDTDWLAPRFLSTARFGDPFYSIWVHLGISFLESDTIMYGKCMGDLFPTKAELALAVVNLMKGYAGYKAVPRPTDLDNHYYIGYPSLRYHDMSNKIILIRREWVDTKTFQESKVRSVFKYPFRIVSRDEMDSIVMSGDPQYIYSYFDPQIAYKGTYAGDHRGDPTFDLTVPSVWKSFVFLDDWSYTGLADSRYYVKPSDFKFNISDMKDLNELLNGSNKNGTPDKSCPSPYLLYHSILRMDTTDIKWQPYCTLTDSNSVKIIKILPGGNLQTVYNKTSTQVTWDATDSKNKKCEEWTYNFVYSVKCNDEKIYFNGTISLYKKKHENFLILQYQDVYR